MSLPFGLLMRKEKKGKGGDDKSEFSTETTKNFFL